MDERHLRNAAKPEGEYGASVLEGMNDHHAPLVDWALGFFSVDAAARVLDVGCGGGANIALFLDACPEGRVDGVDYSDVSVRMSLELNAEAIRQGRCSVMQGDVAALPFDDGAYDVVFACETIYFWPDAVQGLREVARVLAPGGKACIVCEANDPTEQVYQEHPDIMTVYTSADMRRLCDAAGFSQVEVNEKDSWICTIATL